MRMTFVQSFILSYNEAAAVIIVCCFNHIKLFYFKIRLILPSTFYLCFNLNQHVNQNSVAISSCKHFLW